MKTTLKETEDTGVTTRRIVDGTVKLTALGWYATKTAEGKYDVMLVQGHNKFLILGEHAPETFSRIGLGDHYHSEMLWYEIDPQSMEIRFNLKG